MMTIGFLRVSDVDDRTDVDCSTIPDIRMDKIRYLSRFLDFKCSHVEAAP